MTSKILTYAGIGIFTLLIFIAGAYSGATMAFQMNGASYTQEHVDNGKLFLYALKKLEEDKNIDSAIASLKNGLFAKVATVGFQLDMPTNARDKELIESFYTGVIDYLNKHGGLYQTYQVIEDGQTTEKQTAYSILLQEFAENHNKQK